MSHHATSDLPMDARRTQETDDVELSFLTPRFEPEAFPWRQILGYAASLLLTLAASMAVIHRVLPPQALLGVILALAGIQALVQLGFFMHIREGLGPTWHVLTLALGGVVALGIVVFSIWIMTFRWGVS